MTLGALLTMLRSVERSRQMVRLDALVRQVLADVRERMGKDGAAVEAAPQGCETRRKRLAGRNLGCDVAPVGIASHQRGEKARDTGHPMANLE